MNNATALTDTDRQKLLDVAAESIRSGLTSGEHMNVATSSYSEALRETRSSFVTLEKKGALRGCIGSLEATRPIVVDVAHNAFEAAFKDPRFPALAEAEFENLDIHLSLLTVPENMIISSEADLLEQLRPGIDGLVIGEGVRRATFLPSVWESLPEPKEFLSHLKSKAGLSADYWSPALFAKRYTVESIP